MATWYNRAYINRNRPTVIVNRFPGRCTNCGVTVNPGMGQASKGSAGWTVRHFSCVASQPVHQHDECVARGVCSCEIGGRAVADEIEARMAAGEDYGNIMEQRLVEDEAAFAPPF